MSSRHYFMQASKKDAEQTNEEGIVVNRFSDIQSVDKRRHEVLDHMMMGYDSDEIAEYLGVTKAVIDADMKKIMEVGYQAREQDLDEVRDEIMRTYRMAKKEAFRAFKLSQGEIVKVTDEEGVGNSGAIRKTKTTTEQQAGDPRYLSVMIDSAKEMGKVSGAQKHNEVAVQNNIQQNSMNIVSPERSRMPEEFNRWTKKPDDEEVPDAEGIKAEDL